MDHHSIRTGPLWVGGRVREKEKVTWDVHSVKARWWRGERLIYLMNLAMRGLLLWEMSQPSFAFNVATLLSADILSKAEKILIKLLRTEWFWVLLNTKSGLILLTSRGPECFQTRCASRSAGKYFISDDSKLFNWKQFPKLQYRKLTQTAFMERHSID
jgi:hypothetical protein